MKNILIKWKPMEGSKISIGMDAHVFALSQNGRIIFFGNSMHDSLFNEVARTSRRCKVDKNNVTVWLGYIEDNPVPDKESVELGLCLLVYTYQPLYNIVCKGGYYSNKAMRIENRGCLMLHSNIYSPVKEELKGVV